MLRPVVNVKRTGQYLKFLRESKNMTVKQLQYEMGFRHPSTIYKWECGDGIPNVDHLIILARVFSVTVDSLLKIDNVKI